MFKPKQIDLVAAIKDAAKAHKIAKESEGLSLKEYTAAQSKYTAACQAEHRARTALAAAQERLLESLED